MTKEYCGIAVPVFLLGLFPIFFLPMLQVILLVLMLSLLLSVQKLDRQAFKPLLTWPYLAFAQFYFVFLLNALIHPAWERTPAHFRGISIEAWSMSLLCILVLALWLHLQKAADIKCALIVWLPTGLTVSFVVATITYFSGFQDLRAPFFTPSPLLPPFWYLVLTMVSFVWFFEMSNAHKIWRLALFFCAGVMMIYGIARLAMFAWLICSILLVIWFYFQVARKWRALFIFGAIAVALAGVYGVVAVDSFLGGVLNSRMSYFTKITLTYEGISAHFVRLKIWVGALSIISDNVWFGVGKINERAALQLEMNWDNWLRAHQTYLSYLIAGGIPALLSGLAMQSPVLAFLTKTKARVFVPAFFGLGVVVTLNCLTDSIFQSAVNVQAFMLVTLLFLKTTEA